MCTVYVVFLMLPVLKCIRQLVVTKALHFFFYLLPSPQHQCHTHALPSVGLKIAYGS